jgi:hypothetical protein
VRGAGLRCVMGNRTPALPFARHRRTELPVGPRVVHALVVTTCSTSSCYLVQQVDLPVGALNTDVEVAQLARDLIGFGTQLRDRKRGEHLQL